MGEEEFGEGEVKLGCGVVEEGSGGVGEGGVEAGVKGGELKCGEGKGEVVEVVEEGEADLGLRVCSGGVLEVGEEEAGDDAGFSGAPGAVLAYPYTGEEVGDLNGFYDACTRTDDSHDVGMEAKA